MLRTILLPPAPASTPLMRKVLAGQEPTAEDYAESERMNREFQVRHREFQDKDAAWWRLRAEAQAYRASTWPSLRPFLLGPGAVAHAVRRTFTTDGIGGVVGVALCLVLGTLLVQVIPFGPANLLLIPLAASLVANVLGSGLALIARPLGWQGQSVTFLDPIVRFLRQRPIPHNAP